MSSNEYLDNLMAELAEQGIEPPKANINNINTSNVNDKELEIITSMERITGRKFSDEQRKILEYHGNACILACAGSGKALVNGTGVLTPNGYVPIETLKVGDKVFDESGYIQSVVGVYPQGKKQIYKMHFSDGTVIKCCKDHLWNYQTYNMRRTHKRWYTSTTEYLLDNVETSIYPHNESKGSQVRANLYIPMCEPVQFDKKELPIKPYALGALLGDGCIRNVEVNCGYSFTNEDSDVVDRVATELSEIGCSLKYVGTGVTYRINAGRECGYESKFTYILRELGLLNTDSSTKFIPDIYKLSSVEDRLELIKGIIDTDGYCKGSSYELTLKSERLIDDVKFIIETLGMTATKSSKIASCMYNGKRVETPVYRLYIKTNELIPKIHYSSRRDKQWKKGQSWARRTVENIEVTDEYEEMTCIKVSGLSELFLTEHCIVTHNTTISVNLIAKRILTGEIKDVNKLIYTTFSKAGADEMKERMDKLMSQLGMGHINVQVRTLHSFFLSVIRTFGLNKRIINASERTKMVRQACKDAEYSLKDDDLMIIDNLLSYQMNNLLTNKKLVESYVNTLEDLTVEKYSIINASFRKQKDDDNCMDYDDMQYYLWLWLVKWQKSSNQVEKDTAVAVRNYCKAVYTDFYIDEAQDVSKIQFEIIKAIVSDPDNKNKLDKNLVFIGDDDQCIYQWRGSDPSIILTIGAKFNMQTFVLSTNYRCLNEIVDYAATGIKCNNSRFDKSMNAFNKGGSVKIYPSAKEDLCTLSIAALNQIKYWLSQGDKVSDIAVLSRNNFHLALLSNMLLREGIYCNMTEDMKLTKSYMYNDVKDIIALSEPTWKADLTAKVLWRLCRYMGAANSRIIASFQDSCALSLEDTLGWLLKHFVNKDLDFSKKLNINMQAEQQMQYQMAKLSKDTTDDMYMLYRTLSSGSREDKIRSLLYQYLQATSFMYKSKDKNRSITGLVQYVINLMKKDGVDKMLEFMRVTEQLEGGRMVIPGDKLTLTTIHSAKGREWKNVIMFGCDNVSQPSFDGIYGMIQDDIPMSDIFENIDEERRLFYVGNTRAKENLFVITYLQPSIFILEALGAFKDKNGGNNATIVELVSDNQWQERYKDIIQEKIFDSNSKYFYNPEDYKI